MLALGTAFYKPIVEDFVLWSVRHRRKFGKIGRRQGLHNRADST